MTSKIGKYEHIIIALISSKIPDDLIDSDFVIKINTDDWIGTGLTADSVIRLHKIVTIPKSLIKRKLGEINRRIETDLSIKIKQLFDI